MTSPPIDRVITWFRRELSWRPRLWFLGRFRGYVESPFDHLEKGSLFPEDDPLALCIREVLSRFFVCPQARPVCLIGGERIEGDQTPRDIVRPLMGKKISYQVTSAAGNDAAPILGVLLELVPLEGIDLVADEAGDRHGGPPGIGSGGAVVALQAQRRGGGRDQRKRLAPVYLRGCEFGRVIMHRSQYAQGQASTLRLQSNYG